MDWPWIGEGLVVCTWIDIGFADVQGIGNDRFVDWLRIGGLVMDWWIGPGLTPDWRIGN